MQVVWIGNVLFSSREGKCRTWKEMTRYEKKWQRKKVKNMKKNEKTKFIFFPLLFAFFLSLGFRESGITCIWFLIEKMFLEIIVFSLSAIFCDKTSKKQNIWETHVFFFQKKKEIANVLQHVFLVRCAVENHLRWFARFQRCQNKVSFDRPQPEQIKQNKVKSYWVLSMHFFIYVFFVISV